MKTKVIIISIIVIFFILYKLLDTKVIEESFEEFSPVDIPSNLLIQLKKKSDYDLLLILFKLNDCPLCLFEAEYWGQLSNSNKILEIIGITTENNHVKLNEFIDEYNLDFKIINNKYIFHKVQSFLDSNDLKSNTPMKLFIHDSKLIALEKGFKDINEHNKFAKRVNNVFHKIKDNK